MSEVIIVLLILNMNSKPRILLETLLHAYLIFPKLFSDDKVYF